MRDTIGELNRAKRDVHERKRAALIIVHCYYYPTLFHLISVASTIFFPSRSKSLVSLEILKRTVQRDILNNFILQTLAECCWNALWLTSLLRDRETPTKVRIPTCHGSWQKVHSSEGWFRILCERIDGSFVTYTWRN